MRNIKKFLLIFWNLFYDLRIKISDIFFLCIDLFYRTFSKAPVVKSPKETLDYIVENNCSVSRFGDGEIKLAKGVDISFQKADKFVCEKMRQTLSSDVKGHIVCLADIFKDLDRYEKSVEKHWKKHLTRYRKTWYKYTLKDKVYYNAFITRPYMELKDKSGCADWFRSVKSIWDGRDVVFVEGEKSRLGVGNDLFDNAKSIRRILGPVENAFSKYDELLSEVVKTEKSALILLALGPCATAMALDLHNIGYQAVDIGHIDIEYEWFIAGVKKKQPVKNKFVNEAREKEEISDMVDDSYHCEIIAKIL